MSAAKHLVMVLAQACRLLPRPQDWLTAPPPGLRPGNLIKVGRYTSIQDAACPRVTDGSMMQANRPGMGRRVWGGAGGRQ